MLRSLSTAFILFFAACSPSNGVKALPAASNSTCAPCEFAGNEGMCMARNFDAAKKALSDPQLGEALENADTGCTPGQVCVLCRDPRTNEDTGACALAPLACPDDPRFADGSCASPSGYAESFFESCGDDSYCMSYEYIKDEALIRNADICPGDDSKACVPGDVVRNGGHFVLNTCEGLAGSEGRCVPDNMKVVKESAHHWPQSSCTASQRCVSCADPLTGNSLGVCSMGCDIGPASQNAATYPTCGGNDRARCVENAGVPNSLGAYLTACDGNTTCTPTQVLEERYAPCMGQTNNETYRGTCLDTNTFAFQGENNMGDNGYCGNLFGDGFRCVPCTNPGLPGCKDPDEDEDDGVD